MTLIALNHHYVRPLFDHPHPGIHGVTPAQLEAQLRLLATLGTFVSGDQVRDAIEGGTPLPDHAFIVTFDDGLREQYEHALPVLRRLGIPALFFVNTAPVSTSRVLGVHKVHLTRASLPPAEFVRLLRVEARACGLTLPWERVGERAAAQYARDTPAGAEAKYLLNSVLSPRDRQCVVDRCFAALFGGREREIAEQLYMDVGMMRELSQLGFLGSHAHDHLPLGLLPPDEARGQLTDSLALLEAWTGRRPEALSYPYGSREAAPGWVAAVASDLGFHFAFTMERAANANLSAPLQLARFSSNELPGGKTPAMDAAQLFDAASPRRWFPEQARAAAR
ncbi:MAG: polysaccharide deacetylase family protein [Gemmatimonadales bacterium]|nr:polysaccharide deacetylase family protein [Gemmatimonadales bacterium]